jgi:prepilin-type N-terminal cleavage/methylation domain-containing protein
MSRRYEQGFSLVEVMIAMAISGVILIGTMGAMEIASRQVQRGQLSTRALALAQARLEAKRSMRWDALLQDDLDHDGVAEVTMRDDGEGPDRLGGDHVYTARYQHEGVTVVWTVEPDRQKPLASASLVALHAMAFYEGTGGSQEVHLGTLRANPHFAGSR